MQRLFQNSVWYSKTRYMLLVPSSSSPHVPGHHLLPGPLSYFFLSLAASSIPYPAQLSGCTKTLSLTSGNEQTGKGREKFEKGDAGYLQNLSIINFRIGGATRGPSPQRPRHSRPFSHTPSPPPSSAEVPAESSFSAF